MAAYSAFPSKRLLLMPPTAFFATLGTFLTIFRPIMPPVALLATLGTFFTILRPIVAFVTLLAAFSTFAAIPAMETKHASEKHFGKSLLIR